MTDIISIGGATLDIFVHAPHEIVEEKKRGKFLRYPLGGKIKIEHALQSCGGGATNTAVGFARLGLRAGFCGILGDDEWGKAIQAKLTHEGVLQETAIVVEREISGFSIILLDTASGERTILYASNVNAHLRDPTLPKELLKKSRWIFLNHLADVSCMILDDLVEIVQRPGACLAWNPGGSQVREGCDAPVIRDLLRHTDVLFLNVEEACAFFHVRTLQDALRAGKKSGVKIFCITDGERGAWCSDGKTVFACLPVKMSVIDTTGAGDAFGTGVTWGIATSLPLPDALRAGMMNAASVIGKVGSQTGLLHKEEMHNSLSHTALDVQTSALRD